MAVAKYDSSEGRLRGRKAQARRLRLWSINPHCAKCGRLTNYPDGFNLDHKVPLFKGGPDEDENLQVLCVLPDGSGGCHGDKTNEDMGHRERVSFGVDGWPVA
jgi:5-methylcytosine-specific restriction protein A